MMTTTTVVEQTACNAVLPDNPLQPTDSSQGALAIVAIATVEDVQVTQAAATPLPDDNENDFPQDITAVGLAQPKYERSDASFGSQTPEANQPPSELDVAAAIPLPKDEPVEPASVTLPEDNKEDLTQNAQAAAVSENATVQGKNEEDPQTVPVSERQQLQEEQTKKEPEPLTELDLAATTPLPADEREWSVEFLKGLKDLDELKKVYTDVYTSHYQAYKRDGRLYGVFATNQIMAMRNKKTGQVSGMLVDFDALETDPILYEMRPFESQPLYDFKPMDYQCGLGMCGPRYYRHDAESLFYVWLGHASMLKFPGQSNNWSIQCEYDDRRGWFWRQLSLYRIWNPSQPLQETWKALWRLFGDAYFLSREEPPNETLNGHFSVEKLMEAIGVDAETLVSTVDEGSEKEFVSDSDSVQ